MKKIIIAAGGLFIMLTCYANSGTMPFISNDLSAVKLFKIVNNNHPTDVWLTTTTTGGTANAKTGTFTASSELGTRGTYLMIIVHTGMAFHCTTTFSPSSGGQFVLQSNCEMTLLDGQWRVISGTGAYQDLEGNGSIVMTPGHEFCTGKVF